MLLRTNMTHLITFASRDSIYMASDSRMNYFKDREINGEKYQEIIAVADGIQKTFFIENLKIGIQFLGAGFFPEGNKKYPLSYFIEKLRSKKSYSVEENFKTIFDFFKNLSVEKDTGQYIKGVMCAIDSGNKKVCLFNTFNTDFRVVELHEGNGIDSEEMEGDFGKNEVDITKEIKRRINIKSKEKWRYIGGDITLLKIEEDSFCFLLNFNESFKSFNEIKWRIFSHPVLEKYQLTP